MNSSQEPSWHADPAGMILRLISNRPQSAEERDLEGKADVVIVGAGIAGSALALELQKRNISTLLLDRRKGLDATPRGITFQPNGLEALEKIGVLEDRKSTRLNSSHVAISYAVFC